MARKNNAVRLTASTATCSEKKALGVTQPRVSDLLRTRIDLFSTDLLIDMLAQRDRHELVVDPVRTKIWRDLKGFRRPLHCWPP